MIKIASAITFGKREYIELYSLYSLIYFCFVRFNDFIEYIIMYPNKSNLLAMKCIVLWTSQRLLYSTTELIQYAMGIYAEWQVCYEAMTLYGAI